MDTVVTAGLAAFAIAVATCLLNLFSRRREKERVRLALETSPFRDLIELTSANADRILADVVRLGNQTSTAEGGQFRVRIARGLTVSGGDNWCIERAPEIAIVHGNGDFDHPLAAVTVTGKGDWTTKTSGRFDQLDDAKKAAAAALMHRALADFLGVAPRTLSAVERDLAPLALGAPAARAAAPAADTDLLRRISAFIALLEEGARDVPDAALRTHLEALAHTADAIADLLARDPSRAALAQDFADHALPKAHGIVATYLDLLRQPGLSAEERTGLAGVAALVNRLPDTFGAHLRRIREAEIARLADAAHAFAVVSTEVDRVPVDA